MEESDLYYLDLDKGAFGARRDLLRVRFGVTSDNTQIVREVADKLAALDAEGRLSGELLCIDGPLSVPITLTLGHVVSHRYGAVAVFDPKLGGYVVSITHHPDFSLGALLPKESSK